MTDDRVVHIQIATCDLTLSQVIHEIERIAAENPDREVWLDGDRYAIVSQRKGRA